MDQLIEIRLDFALGNELSYIEGLNCKHAFATHCLEFFSTDNPNAYIIRRDGKSIYVRDVLDGLHCDKQIRKEHNIRKMLLAGCFSWL